MEEIFYTYGGWISGAFIIALGFLQLRAETGKKNAYAWWVTGILVFFLWAVIFDREAALIEELRDALTPPGNEQLALELLDEHPFLATAEEFERYDDGEGTRMVPVGIFPIHLACSGGFVKVVEVLIQEGEADRPTSGGMLPATLALQAPQNGEEILGMCLQAAPASLNNQAFRDRLVAVPASFFPVVLKAGLSPNAAGARATLLNEAIRYRDEQKVKYLLEAGADIAQRDRGLAHSLGVQDWLPPDPEFQKKMEQGRILVSPDGLVVELKDR